MELNNKRIAKNTIFLYLRMLLSLVVSLYTSRVVLQNDNTGEWKRLKSAELLLENDLETKFICGFVVYNQKAKNELVSFGIESCKIEIRPNYYF